MNQLAAMISRAAGWFATEPAVLVDHMAELSRRLIALTGANRVGRRQAVTP